ncbi:MAG TPA: hypothetical protein VEI03_01100 [Stellaceae bacterium]|nr:hypothetical protein [Stellaceae bacterium]
MAAVKVVDSITKLDASDAGQVLIAASHGGVYPAYLAAKAHLRGVILHDAGLGLDRAGIASLDYLDRLGMAAATIGHLSARIGDGADMAARGRVSHVNRAAAALGCVAGENCRDCAEKMLQAAPCAADPPSYEEARFLLRHEAGEPEVWGIDSNALVRAEDAGMIVVTGSHGGLLGGRPESAIRVAVRAAVYHDAGIGIDRAGISRLPALEGRGIIAATVAGETARIGEARSVWQSGRLSTLNPAAERVGARLGMAVPDFVAAVIAAGKSRRAAASGV